MGKEQVLKQVRDAERRVREILEETEHELDQKQAQTRREADRIVEEGFSNIDKLMDDEYQKAAEETRRLVERRVREGSESVDKERQDSMTQLSEAVDRLLQELERSVTQG